MELSKPLATAMASMSCDNATGSRDRTAPSAASRASILRVWDIVNRHFESLLATVEGSSAKSRAEINILSQAKELRGLIGEWGARLATTQDYISELQKQETGALNGNRPSHQTQSSELLGDWHFLYTEDNNVFGYMKLVPETVSVTSENCHGGGASNSFKRAEFTIPSAVLDAPLDAPLGARLDGDSAQPDRRCGHALCPCCRLSFESSEFWKHALFEIAEKGNRVPARQSLARSETTRWIVEERSGWTNPIYRPRDLESTCEIGQSLAELNLRHFLSDYDFSRALDSTFEFLAFQLST